MTDDLHVMVDVFLGIWAVVGLAACVALGHYVSKH